MNYGLTENGFVIKRLPVIKSELEQDFRDVFGDIDVSEQGPFGQIIGVISKGRADLWEMAQIIYDSQRPSAAVGIQLDEVVSLNGLVRLGASQSNVWILLFTDQPMVTVPANARIQCTLNDEVFILSEEVLVSNSDLHKIVLESDDDPLTDGITYQLDINGYTLQETAGVGQSAASFFTDFAATINANVNVNDVIEANEVDGELVITTKDFAPPLGFLVANIADDVTGNPSTKFLIVKKATAGYFLSENEGEIAGPQNTITDRVSPVSGFIEADNPLDAVEGREVETDAELRLRRAASLSSAGGGTIDAIRAALLQLPGVTAVFVYENRDDAVDGEGRPGHSIECVVAGGVEQSIGDTIWATKPAGIETVGFNPPPDGVQVDVTDANGDTQVMNYSTPNDQDMYVEVEYTRFDEETFPTGGEDAMLEAVLDYGAELTIAEDVIPQRFVGPIFDSTEGIENVIVRVRNGSWPGGSGYTTKVSIGEREVAVFDETRVQITDVTP